MRRLEKERWLELKRVRQLEKVHQHEKVRGHQRRTTDLWSQRWWEMVLEKSMVPLVSQHISKYQYQSTDLSTVDWSLSISTVDSITPTEEYGRCRRSFRLNLLKITVDRGLSVNNRDNLWSILSTIPVDLEFNLKMITNYDFDGKKLQHPE